MSSNYISLNLSNPEAAERLIDDVEKAILQRVEVAGSFAPIPSSLTRPHPYYAIVVRNYAVFYVLIEDVMEVRRFLYKGQDFPELLP